MKLKPLLNAACYLRNQYFLLMLRFELKYISATMYKFELIEVLFCQFSSVLFGHQCSGH